MKLVIVESPAKCATIKRYLGDDYQIMASFGHVRDLATSGQGGLGVDIESGFLPSYILNKDKIHVVKDLQKVAKQCDEVILATDPDREGEAIAWHLARVLNLNLDTTKRMEFHEITRDSINEAVNNPRTIDKNLVASQETRRILDRIIGFKLSSLLYKKIRSRSAGRVQSATLKLIFDHEAEIEKFVPEEYWTIATKALIHGKEMPLTFVGMNGKSIDVKDEDTAENVIVSIPKSVKVSSIKKIIREKESKEPFTTSTLQQEAFARLKFKTKKTQYIAQELYEGIEVAGEHVGLITYMRTDSTRLSPIFVARAKNYIIEAFGKEYLGHEKKFKQTEMTQDAHEAIRPTSNHRTPESVRPYLTPDQYNLYKLIYNRALASLMKAKKEETMTIELEGNDVQFQIQLTRTLFKGYEVVLEDKDDEKSYFGNFPDINVGDEFEITNKEADQKFTQPPAHYSEAKIVKLMEEMGIGRPSTYASTIDTLRERKYVLNNGGILTITDQGKKTSIVLKKYFPDIVDVKYTAQMELKLDNVEDGSQSRVQILSDFYYPFLQEVKDATEKMYKDESVPTGELCPKCGAPLIYREGKNGKFVGCSNFPECKYVKKEAPIPPKETGETCPDCGAPLVERKDKKGHAFIGCSNYPKCRFIKKVAIEEEEEKESPKIIKKCPKCGGDLVRKKGKFGYFLGCSNYPKCNYMEKAKKSRRK